MTVPPSGGSLEIGNLPFKATYNPREEFPSSPFGGIPRNWKLIQLTPLVQEEGEDVPPSGGSLEIGNSFTTGQPGPGQHKVPPSGGSLEIGNQDEPGCWEVRG